MGWRATGREGRRGGRGMGTDPLAHDEGLAELRGVALLLGVDADEVEVLPDLLDDLVHVEVPLAADHHGVRQPRQPVHLLDRNRVHLPTKRGGDRSANGITCRRRTVSFLWGKITVGGVPSAPAPSGGFGERAHCCGGHRSKTAETYGPYGNTPPHGHLVVDADGGEVLPVALHDVDEVVHRPTQTPHILGDGGRRDEDRGLGGGVGVGGGDGWSGRVLPHEDLRVVDLVAVEDVRGRRRGGGKGGGAKAG